MLDSVVNKFQKNGIQVTVRGLNEASSIMIDKYGTHAKSKKVLRDLFNLNNYFYCADLYSNRFGLPEGFLPHYYLLDLTD